MQPALFLCQGAGELQDNSVALHMAMACLLMLQPSASNLQPAPKLLSKLTTCMWFPADTVQQPRLLQSPALQLVMSCCRGAGDRCRQRAPQDSIWQDAEQPADISTLLAAACVSIAGLAAGRKLLQSAASSAGLDHAPQG